MNEEDVTRIVRDTGLPEAAVVALLANIAVETGNTFDPSIKQRGASNPAQGLLQFDPKGKLPDYQEYLKENAYKDNAQNQINYFMDTIYGPNMDEIGRGNALKLQKIIETGNHEEVTKALSDLWFKPGKPHLDRRLEEARNRYSVIQSEAEPASLSNPLFKRGEF